MSGMPILRMPVGFGPPSGPRQGPDGARFDWTDNPERVTASVHFRTSPDALAKLLPPALQPVGNPVVTLEMTALRNLAWLGGRGYDMFGVKFPARFRGREDDVTGLFLAVLWENMADPIISGREELGYNKLYCELPPPQVQGAAWDYQASWGGHVFFRQTLETAADQAAPAAPDYGLPAIAGILHHKYIPRTGSWGEADADYITLTPAAGSAARRVRAQAAAATIRFVDSTWQQLPTLHHVVNALAGLPVEAVIAAGIEWAVGGKDLRDQRILV